MRKPPSVWMRKAACVSAVLSRLSSGFIAPAPPGLPAFPAGLDRTNDPGREGDHNHNEEQAEDQEPTLSDVDLQAAQRQYGIAQGLLDQSEQECADNRTAECARPSYQGH